MKYNIDTSNIPNHIAIIMDGNGRYAQKKGLPRTMGHKDGAENLKTISKFASDIGVKHMTVYAFSTENWKRPTLEVTGIMKLLGFYLGDWKNQIGDNDLRIRVIGDLSGFDASLRKKMAVIEEETKNAKFELNIALGYGGRDEIVKASQAFAHDVACGRYAPEDLTESLLSSYLYSKNVPDPELIIRPSGEMRTSNFLLWQSAYSEYVFMDVLWPDFGPEDLERAIAEFNGRNRRFGGV